MQKLFSLVNIDKNNKQPAYLQLASQLLALIRSGALQAGEQLPPTRTFAQALGLNRQTIVKAFDELLLQGWLQSHTGRGTFVASHLPEIKLQGTTTARHTKNALHTAGFSFAKAKYLDRETPPRTTLHLDDGFPDARLAPLDELARAYRSQLLNGHTYTKLGYADPKGSLWLRQQLCNYLHETRGFAITPENIVVTRGTTMGLYLACTALLAKGDVVAVGALNWRGGTMNFLHAGTKLLTIPVDENGLNIDALEKACKRQAVRMLYITSHHQYPTTVALSAGRRVRLLALAERYGFIIFEDDYDYDFHYLSKPLLPLAAADKTGMCLYAGSFTKAVAPAFRVGYIIAPENVVNHLATIRRFVDRQGDTMLENAFADLLQSGVIQRHLRKSLRVYRERRDFFCALAQQRLGEYMQFNVPDGGMAVWANFDDAINLPALAEKALKRDLYFYNGAGYYLSQPRLNATRLGFASSTPAELERCVDVLEKLLV